MDDPSSYQFLSIDQPDSVSNHSVVLKEQANYLERLQAENDKLVANNLHRISESLDESGTKLDKEISRGRDQIDSLIKINIAALNEKNEKCSKELLEPDSLNHLNIRVNFRGKNKLGALVLNKMPLSYYPSGNRFTYSPE